MSSATRESTEAFIRENYDDVYRYLYHRVFSVADAQDLVQEVFMRYVKGVGKRGSRAKGRAYLFTIARNISIDHYRAKKPEPVQITTDLEEILEDTKQEEADGFDELVEELPPDMQELLSLRYAQDFGVNEIAEITGLSRFAVRRRTNQALAMLKSAIKEESV